MGLFDNLRTMFRSNAVADRNEVDEDRSLTLGKWLKESKFTPEQVLGDSYLLTRATRALLAANDIPKPTNHQLHETRFALTNALKEGTWSDFRSPTIPGLLDVEQGSDCCPGNVFFERDGYSTNELKPEAIELTRANEYKLKHGYTNACLGQVIAGTFISGNARSSNDFSHVYGDEAWDCYLRTWTMLDEIPKGELLNRLDLDLVTETNRLVHAPDPRTLSKFFRMVGAITRGRMDVAGRIRDGRTVTQSYTFTNEEIEHLQELGIRFHPYPALGVPSGSKRGYMEYPEPETIRDGIRTLIAQLKEEMSGPDPDPIGSAAKFCRGFVALHPYEDSNGRTGRVLMNRLLEEFGYPPAILSNADNDLTMGTPGWRQEVVEGIAHTKRYLEKSDLFAVDSLLAKEKITVPLSGNSNRVVLNQLPFSRGADGFLYDVTGRPHLATDKELHPLSQLEYFLLVRRFVAMPRAQAIKKLSEITAPNLRLIEAIESDKLPADFHLGSDLSAREADSHYRIRGTSPAVQTIASLLKLENLDPTTLFKIPKAKGTEASSILSKYNQLDLEYWTIETALKKTKQKEAGADVRKQREALFSQAQNALKGAQRPELISPDNPNGFKYRYEQIMYAASPLRYNTLSEAIAGLTDDHVTIWRGDYGFSKVIGMAPNNDPRQDAARVHSEAQFERQVVPHILQDLKKLERTGVGSHYISHTSDLSLLTGRFANKKATRSLNIDALPEPIAFGVGTFLGEILPEPNPGLRRSPDDAGTALRDSLGLEVHATNSSVTVNAHRKAFELKVLKSSLLPGMVSLSSAHPFAYEQEMHGLERVSPREIYNSYTTDELKTEFTAPDAGE